MKGVLLKFNLAVKKLRGKNEFEMYKNYIKDLPSERIALFTFTTFETGGLKQKNDAKARFIKIQGNYAYLILRDYEESLRLYTKSLRCANYNSEEYAIALANRSAVLFTLEDYKSSIDDINLCLRSKYPNHLKPKLYIRKSKCFQKLGNVSGMRKTLVQLMNYLDNTSASLEPTAVEEYKKAVKDLITASAEEKTDPEDTFDVLPPLKANPTFVNASSSVTLKHNKDKGYHVVAKEEIAQGDVLFVEKAYAFIPDFCNYGHPKKYRPIHCQYCFLKITSCIPCKGCVKHLYCNEKCRDAAWKEFHQWECIGIQGGFFNIGEEGYLALRLIVKAVAAGISTEKINSEDAVNSYGDSDNNYPYVYNLPSSFHKMEKSEQMAHVAFAALAVDYLKKKTNFFDWMGELPAYSNQSCKQLMGLLGALIIKHSNQFFRNAIFLKVFDNSPTPNLTCVGTALCPSVAMMGHSCTPNTAHYFVGNTIVVKATKNIKISEEVCRTFSDFFFMMMDVDDRKALLQKLLHMKCTCQSCSDPRKDMRDAYFCVKCNGPALPLNGYPFGPKNCICLVCNYTFQLSSDVIAKERFVLGLPINFGLFGEVDGANQCLEISKTIFYPNHSIFRILYGGLLQYYKEKGEAEGYIKIGNMSIDYFENIYCEFATPLATIIYALCVDLEQILQETAVKLNTKDLRKMLDELTGLVEKAKMVFSFHYPPFGVRLRKLEKSISRLRTLHNV